MWQHPTEGQLRRIQQDIEFFEAKDSHNVAGWMRICIVMESHVIWSVKALPPLTELERLLLRSQEEQSPWLEYMQLMTHFGHFRMAGDEQNPGGIMAKMQRPETRDGKWRCVELAVWERLYFGYDIRL